MTSTETIVFPDAVAVAIRYLSAALVAGGDSETHVGAHAADTDRFIIVSLAGTEKVNLVMQRSIVRFECWAGDGPFAQENSQDLGQLARALLVAMGGTVQAGATIYRVTDPALLSGLENSPDPISGKDRYTFHLAISMRGGASLDPSTVVTIPDWFHGTQGPQGPPGPAGGTFTFEQDIASATWTIEHDLGFFPAVSVVDTLGREFEGAVTYVDDNNLIVEFAVPVTGKAYLS